MTSRERMLAVMKGEPIDRLPVEIHFVDARVLGYYASHYGMTPDAFFEYLENDMRYVHTMDEVGCYMQDEDLIKESVRTGFAFPVPGKPHAYTDTFGITWDASAVGQRPLSHGHTWEELKDFQMPDPHKAGMFYDFDKKVPGYREKDLAYVALQYYGPLEKLENIRGFENTMMDFYEEPDKIEELLDKVTDYRVALAEDICARGVVMGHGGDDYGVQAGPIMSMKTWRRFIKPRLARIYKVYKDHGLPVLHHSCGNCEAFIDDLLEIGVDALHPIQSSCMNIQDLYKRYGDRIVYYGGFDMHYFLEKASPEDVRRGVKETIETLGKNGRMVCAAINIMDDVPLKNFEALIEGIKEYRYLGAK